jgi:5-formyltetrahydrofolate cyclo-ligase
MSIKPLPRNILRKELRLRRRALGKSFKHRVSKRVMQLLIRHGWLKHGQRVGIYLAMDEEVSLSEVIDAAQHRGCSLFLPQIINTRRRIMKFYPYHQQSRLIVHRWGIRQLARTTLPCATRSLDLVLVPLVGFDDQGHRLGMGGGFYDRHFAFLRNARVVRPKLIGVAFSCQKISAIDAQPHDIQLNAVVSEHGLTKF